MIFQNRFCSVLLILVCLLAYPCQAADAQPARDVPQISYAQKVDIVVAAKRNPMIFDLQIDQERDGVSLIAVVDKNVDHEIAQKLASDIVMLAKSMTLDDRPTSAKEPGKGLYNYGIKILRVDQVELLTARKMATDPDIKVDPPMMQDLPVDVRPLTRGDGRP